MEEKIQLTLNPEQKTAEKLLDSVPTMQSVVNKSESNYSAGTIDESMLSEEEKTMVEQFASEIDIENVDQIVNYGIKAQTNISEFSTTILKKVKTYDLGEVGDSLKELTVALDATTEPEKKGILGIFQKAKRGVGSIRANYAKAESNVDRIEKDLIKHRDVLGQDISMYQQMYELNVQYYKELTMYIIAGKKALDRAKSTKLAQLKSIAENSDKQEDVQAYRDYEDLCHRFEKKLSDLEITRVISIQSAPQVRMLQNNDREMMDKLQSSLANTIPALHIITPLISALPCIPKYPSENRLPSTTNSEPIPIPFTFKIPFITNFLIPLYSPIFKWLFAYIFSSLSIVRTPLCV